MFDLDDLTAPYVLLEDRLTPGAPARLYATPEAIIRCEDAGGVDAALQMIEQGLADGLHAAGFFAYELGYALEPRLAPRMPQDRDAPLLWFGLFKPPRLLDQEALDTAFARLGPPPPITDVGHAHDRAGHAQKVRDILDLIAAGDVYQVNLTFPLRFRYAHDPLALYAALRAAQPVAHGGIAALGDMTVLSVSPELWVDVRDGQATTRPMKGTSARGDNADADDQARASLAADAKQRAENLMIVDLLRNDLSRIAEPGTVRTPDLFTVETYPSFHAMTSTVTARLNDGVSLRERVAALFPCGSIVGAPKIHAAEIIRELEASPRGVYTGALGAIAPDGEMTFNVAIRTAVLTSDGAGRYDVGGGVVADSDPEGEYEEACLKARVMTDLAEDFGLIETFRWSRTEGFVRLDLHLARLVASARQLGFVFDVEATRALLDERVADWSGDQRVRLQLARNGALDLTHADVVASKAVLSAGLATQRLDPGDPFLAHKTTRRGLYERAFAEAARLGLDEVIFVNRRSEVSEASRNSVFVEIDGELVTPPLACGVLPGVLRQHLIETGQAVERIVPVHALTSHPIRLGSSLHGLRAARLEPATVWC